MPVWATTRNNEYETKIQTIMMVTTANSVVSAPLTQKIEYRPFKAGVEMAEFSWSTIMRLWCIGCIAAFQAVGSGSTPDRRFIYRSVAESIRNALKMRRPKGIVGSCPTRSTNGMWSNW